jgi:hypothetical protein
MSVAETMRDEGSVEECLDDFAEQLARLERYPLGVLAVAMRVHLQALLQVMLLNELCTRAEVRAFLRDLEHDALEFEGS